MDIERHLRQNWDAYFPGEREPRRLWFILVKGRKGNMIFVSGEKSKLPICVVRVASELGGHGLKKSFSALKKLDDLNLSTFQNTYPRVLFFGNIDGCEALIQSFVRAERMTKFIRNIRNPFWRNTLLLHLSSVNKWLVELHKNTRHNEILLDESSSSKIFGSIKDKLNTNPEVSRRSLVFVETLGKKAFFNVFQHGDFQPDNILIKKDRSIAILDWDLSEPEGFPLWDLLEFLISYSRILFLRYGKRRGELIEYLAATFFKDNSFSRIAATTISEYSQQLGITSQVAKLLFLLWLDKRFDKSSLLEYALIHCEQCPFSIEIQDSRCAGLMK